MGPRAYLFWAKKQEELEEKSILKTSRFAMCLDTKTTLKAVSLTATFHSPIWPSVDGVGLRFRSGVQSSESKELDCRVWGSLSSFPHGSPCFLPLPELLRKVTRAFYRTMKSHTFRGSQAP